MFKKLNDKILFFVGTVFSNYFYFKTHCGQYRVFKHRGTKADCGVIKQIFVKKEYSLRKSKRQSDIIDSYNAILNQNKKPLIIDAGANIGASVLWFTDNFPNSHVIAFEPDSDNIKLLKKNTNGLDVDIREAAIGSVDDQVSIVDPGHGEWGYQTKNDPNGLCNRQSVSRIISEKIEAGYVPFIFKIDIEGGEENLFEINTGWIDLFPLIIIELHDWLIPNKNTSLNFLKSISQFKRDFVYNSENIFSFKNNN